MTNREDLQAALIQDDNINVSKTNEGFNLLIFLGGLIFVVILIIAFFGTISDIFISNMSDKTQMKVERLISFNSSPPRPDIKYNKNIEKLNEIKNIIISKDKSLRGKSNFPIFILEDSNVNACIFPNGTIYITSETLKQRYKDDELAFILAHEIGHYAHRDHLRIFSRQILIGLALSSLGCQNASMANILNGITDIESLAHSRSQEKNADIYASNMLIKMYGSNKGGKDFIKKIQEKENSPEFLKYFSTHPSWQDRLKILENS